MSETMSAMPAETGLAPETDTISPLPSGSSKRGVVEELGEDSLLLPALVNQGLEANDRAKYFLSLLQTARAQADEPDGQYSSLRDERLAAGIADEQLDRVVGGSRTDETGAYIVPLVRQIHAGLIDAIHVMLVPLSIQSEDAGYGARLDDLVDSAPDLSGERITGVYIDLITAGGRQADSLHLLVMDAHRALNRLQSDVATETLDGAAVYRLADRDRPLVAAFVSGVRITSPLKFDHPGLGTTATRSGRRLLIQNDIGGTEEHVVVITVDDLTTTITYTDVHLQRLRFLQSLLEEFPVDWSDVKHHHSTASLGEFHLTVGRYAAPDAATLEAYLAHLGSRLVFLIDWNRARKRLRKLVGKKDAIGLLRWSADNGFGHMGFLLLGGDRLVYDAIELAARSPARYGEPLEEVIGPDATIPVLRFALRSAAEGLLAGKSHLLIRDELRIELARHMQAAHGRLLSGAAEHASLVVETARTLSSALLRLGSSGGDEYLSRAVARAARWEHRADEVLSRLRIDAQRVEAGDALTTVVAAADDAIDDLEEALFLMTLLPGDATAVARSELGRLAKIGVSAAREQFKAIEIAREVIDGGGADDQEDFLVAVDRVVTLEHDADTADRRARAALITDAPDFRSLHVADRISAMIEDATDALMHSALYLRDHVLARATIR